MLVCFDFLTSQNKLFKIHRTRLTEQLHTTDRKCCVLQHASLEALHRDERCAVSMENFDGGDDFADFSVLDQRYIGDVKQFAVVDMRQVYADAVRADPNHLQGRKVLRFYIGKIVDKAAETV